MITPTELQVRTGISKGYASDLLAGNKKPSPAMALKIFHATGLKLGSLSKLSDEEVAIAEKMRG